jgi:hypothetical protein
VEGDSQCRRCTSKSSGPLGSAAARRDRCPVFQAPRDTSLVADLLPDHRALEELAGLAVPLAICGPTPEEVSLCVTTTSLPHGPPLPRRGNDSVPGMWNRALRRGMRMAVPIPTDIITLMFTDIQDSSARWEKLGPRFRPVLERHNQLIREIIQRWDGYEVKSQGDSFMVAFQRGTDAVQCAIAIQRALLEQG